MALGERKPMGELGLRPPRSIKTFGERCSEITVNNKQELADILFSRSRRRKGGLRHKNKVAVFQKGLG